MSVEQESAGKFTAIRLTENELKKGAGASFCEICSRTFANGNAYRFHRIKKHAIIGDERDLALFNCTPLSAGAERRYFCPASDCRYSSGRYFRAYKLLRQHFLKVHCEKQFRCDQCKTARFSLRRDLIYHQRKRCCGATTSTPASAESKTFSRKRKSSKKSSSVQCSESLNAPRIAPKGQAATNIFIITLNAPLQKHSSFKDIRPKFHNSRMPSAEKATQTSDGPVAACCHASSQTVQRSIPEFFPPIFHEQNDFHCQTRIASGVEFGTQISPEDVDSISVMQQQQQQQNAKTHDDFEFEDIWRHIETQTPAFTGNDVLTQTAIDFMDSASMTDWNLLIS